MFNVTTVLPALVQPNAASGYGPQAARLLLRVTVGAFMVHNGLDKLADIENFATAYVAYIGLPFPITLSYIAAYTELIGAPLVALGLLTRPAALGLVATMGVAIYHHLLVGGLNATLLEPATIYAACFAFFAINGAGQFSLDALLKRWLQPQRS